MVHTDPLAQLVVAQECIFFKVSFLGLLLARCQLCRSEMAAGLFLSVPLTGSRLDADFWQDSLPSHLAGAAPGKPAAGNYGLLPANYELLRGIVAFILGNLTFQLAIHVEPCVHPSHIMTLLF